MIRRAPYPLPPKRKREKMGIERAPKRVWLRHRRFVKSHHCCVPGCQALLVDPAHLRGINNAGTSLKPHDWFIVPLCRNHHQEQEPIGPDAFGDRHGIDLWAIAAELVRRSPDAQMRRAMMLEEGEVSLGPPPVLPRAARARPVNSPAIPILAPNAAKPRVVDLSVFFPRFIPVYGQVNAADRQVR